MARQLLGKEVVASLNARIMAKAEELKNRGITPALCIIRVGENPGDISYERGATKRCETLGVDCGKVLLPEDVSQDELLKVIEEANNNDKIHGVLLQEGITLFCTADIRSTYVEHLKVFCCHFGEFRFVIYDQTMIMHTSSPVFMYS